MMSWVPTASQPRPGLIEANSCVKRILASGKISTVSVLTVSTDNGLRCVDTNFNPPKVLMSNSVFELAHCGVDVSKPMLVTCIVGSKGENSLFFCHVFKCDSKEAASSITQTIAAACTRAFQDMQERSRQPEYPPPIATPSPPLSRGGQGGSFMGRAVVQSNGNYDPPAGAQVVRSSSARASPQGVAAPILRAPSLRANNSDSIVEQRRQQMRNASMKVKTPSKLVVNVRANLSEPWFQPTMRREDVNSNLRIGRVGDFLVRESLTQVGDYAISVQTGRNIWTGLLLHSASGFQLGSKNGLLFDELVQLISYYADVPFMNDDFGYPLKLNLPDPLPEVQSPRQTISPSTSSSSSKPSSLSRNAPSRGSVFRNPPMFEEASAITRPSCGWPDDPSTDDDKSYNQFVDGASPMSPSFEVPAEMSEREAFEKFMDSDLAREGVVYDDDEEEEHKPSPQAPPPLPARNQVSSSVSSLDKQMKNLVGPGSRDFNVDDMPEEEPEPISIVPPQVNSSFRSQAPAVPPIRPLVDSLFAICAKDGENCISGLELRPHLMKSGLDTSQLGQIWMEVDVDRRGRLDYDQVGLVLGLISMVQQGRPMNLEILDPSTVTAPTMTA